MVNEKKIISMIKEDQWMMEILRIVKLLDLADCWICAGFVRSKIWDRLHGFKERTPIPDIDVIYFDPINMDEAEERMYEEKLSSISPNIPWSVKNQARMHIRNNVLPYQSSIDAISKFPETATALGVKLDHRGNIVLTAPCGTYDVMNLKVKPTPFFIENREKMEAYEKRLTEKNWQSTWQYLKITHMR